MASFDDAFNAGGTTEPIAQTMTDQLASSGAPMPPDYQPGLTVNPADVMTRMLRKGISDDQARSIQKKQQPPADLASYGETVTHVDPAPRPTPEPEPEPVGGALSTGARAAGQEAVGIGGQVLQGVSGIASAVPSSVRRGVGQVLGGIVGGPGAADALGQIGEALGPQDGQSATEAPAYKAGKAIEDYGQKVFPVSDAERQAHPIASTVGGALGGVVPALALGMLDPAAALAGGAALFGFSSAGSTFKSAKEKGADDATAREAAALSGVVGAAAGALDVGAILKPFGVLAPEATGWAMRTLARAAEGGVTFATVGEAQEFLGQQVAKMYDPNAHYDFDVNRLYGELIAGGLLGGIHGALSGRGREETPPPPIPNDPNQRLPGPGPGPGNETGTGETGPGPGPGTGGGDAASGGAGPGAGHGAGGEAGAPGGEQAAGPGAEPPPRAGPQADTPGQTRRRGAMEDAVRGYGIDPSDMSFDEMRDTLHNRDILAMYGFTKKEIQDLGGDHTPAFQAALKEAMEAGSQHPSTGEGSAGTASNPVDASGIDAVKSRIDADPSAAQAQAENYPHIHAEIPELGLTGKNGISIETVKGGTRKGPVDATTGQPAWTSTMGAHYGRIKGTLGADGQQLDIFTGTTKDAPLVFVLDQMDPKTGKFDEHKVFARFKSAPEAYQAYLASHDATGRTRIGGMRAFTPAEFQAWIASGKTTEPVSDSMKSAAAKAPAEPVRTSATQGQPDKPADAAPATAAPPTTQKGPAAPSPQQAAGPGGETTGGAGGPVSPTGAKPTPAESVPQPEKESSRPPAATAEQVQEVRKTLAEAGVTPYPNDHVDIMRAIRIKDRELYDMVDAFQIAVLRNRLDDGLITPEQVRDEQPAATAEAVLNESQENTVVLEPAGAPERGVSSEAPSASAGGETATSEPESGTTRGGEAGEQAGPDRTEVAEGGGGTESNAASDEPDTSHAESDTGGAATVAEDGGRSEPVTAGGEPAAESHDEAAEQSGAAGEYPTEHAGEREDAGTTADAGDLTEAHDRHRAKFGRKNLDVMESELAAMEDQIAEHEAAEKRDNPEWSSEDDPQWQTYIQDIAQMRDDIDEALVAVGKPAKYAAEDAAAAGETQTAETTNPGKTKKTKAVETAASKGEKQDRTKMQDVGEVLAGSRKDRASGISSYDEIKDLSGSEQAGRVTKEGVWPRPDYSDLVEKGLDPQVAYLLKTIYDRIPTKPGRYDDNPEGRRKFIDALNAAREALEAVKTHEDVRAADDKTRILLRDRGLDHRETFDALRPTTGPHRHRNPFGYSNEDVRKAEREVKQGWPNKEPWKRFFRISARYRSGEVDPDYRVLRRSDSGLIGVEDNLGAAQELAEKAYQDMRAQNTGEKLPDRPHLDKLERVGPDMRAGRKLTETDFMNEFGFRGVQFGDWVRSDEGRKIVDHAFDALHDLARVLGVDPRMMSLDGTLGMAFGARGGGKFAAHYEPAQLIINITKIRGAGSLAHEWGHALDRFLGELDRPDAYKGGFRMESGTEGGHKKRSYFPTPSAYEPNTHNESKRLRPDVRFAFEALMERLHTRVKTRGEFVNDLAQRYNERSAKLAAVKASPSWAAQNKKWIPQEEQYIVRMRQQLTRVSRGEDYPRQARPSDFLTEAQKISKSGDYWVRPTELFARSFESYVFDKLQAADQKSQFLVQGVEPDRYAMGYRGNPYPYARDREDIDYDYDRLFRALGRYTLKSKAERATIPWVKDPFTPEDLAPLARDEETVEPWWPESEASNEHTGAGESGEETLGEVAPGEGEGTAGGGEAAGGDTRGGEPGAGSDQPSDDAQGLPGTRSKGGGAEAVHPPETGAEGGDAAGGEAGPSAGGESVPETPASVTAEETKPQTETPPPPPVPVGQEPNIPGINYRITDETALGHGSEDVKFKDNLAAVNVLKDMEREGRRATPDEQRVLARYVGWGGLSNAFSEPPKAGWEKRVADVAAALTPEELRQARRSTPNAHYTSKTVIDAMWSAVKRFGFKGGLSLELSAGTGNFIGLAPPELKTKFIAVEYDSLTARIAQALYPQETVLHSGIQYVPLPDGEAVLNIGNPPFGKGGVRFQYKPGLNGMSIHNQFFLAGLDALRPGGIQALVVSHYLMDSVSSDAREKLAIKGKLLGMIRLPDTAFQENAKTEVVTDIVFLQRNTSFEEKAIQEAVDASHERPRKGSEEDKRKAMIKAVLPSWVGTDKVRDPLGGEPMVINRYFAENPHMILGRLERSGTMYGGEQVNVKLDKGADLADLLKRAVGTLPRDVLNLDNEVMEATLARHHGMSESLKIALAGHEVGHVEYGEDGKLRQVFEQETPNGGYEVKRRPIDKDTPWSHQLMLDAAGRWYTLAAQTDDKGAKLKTGKRNVYARKYFPDNKVPASMQLGETKFDRLKDMVTLRDLTKKQLTLEADDAPTKEMEGNRKKLAAAYKAFVDKNGLLNEPRNSQLAADLPDGALIMALETGYRAPITNIKAARTGQKAAKASATPAPIMSRRVVPKYEPATKADTPADALSITLSERGRVDMPRIAALLGMTEETAAEKLSEGEKPLVYKDPESGNWETANDYLSGQVARKLEAAKAAGLHENVKALEAVQPEKWGADNITPMMGANWIPTKVYADFATHLVGGDQKVNYGAVTNSFAHESSNAEPAKVTLWRTERMPFEKIYDGMLNSHLPKVYDEDADGNKHLNVEATTLVGLKAKEIENEFADWIFKDGDRRNQLVDFYNDKFNTRVNRQHDGSHLTLPGKVPDAIIRLRRSQLNGVWRGIIERNVLYDHVVGAGKTFTAIARAMERRRMGLSRKPMIVVPNHLVDQWTQDVYKLYPGAKVLAAGNNQFTKQNRRRLFAKIATGDHDIVIVPHSSFGYIGISPDTEHRFLEEEMRVALQAVKDAEEAAAESGIGGFRKPYTVKQAEQLVAKLQGRMDALRMSNRDRMLTFEQMGIDDMTIDEAHEFKNLFYHTRMTGVRGMGDQGGSKKAFDLYNKVRVLNESPTGSVVFMTGTPISNSAVEMYSMMRYLAASQMKELGLEHFDAWRTQSVSATPKWEPTEAGGLKEVTRLGRSWSNMRALMELYRTFADSVTQEDLNKAYAEDNNGESFPVPQVKGGGRKEVVVKPTPAQLALLENIVDGFNHLPDISNPDERNAERLRLMDKARKVSLDARAVDKNSTSTEKGGKLEKIADNVARIHKQWDKDAGTQLIFLDRGVKAAKGDNKIIKDYDDLVAKRDALDPTQEEQYRDLTERLDKFDPREIEELRRAQGGGWNAYDQLKANLIKRGIPADEIRFAQEANNDAEKKALFDTVNDGKTRVLIGSTPRMGAGTNVQERLVALHHADVTWKPSDIEQREGRIIRQGNKLLEKYGKIGHNGGPSLKDGDRNFEVEILAYVTERTVDAKMWDLNATKLRMINGIRKYDGAFNMEFEDEEAVGMAEIAALASGDPLLLERVKAMAEIDKLELLERAHRRKLFGIDDQIDQAERAKRDYPAMIKETEDRADEVKAAMGKVADAAAARSVTIEGKKYTTRMEAEAAAQASYEAQKKGDENAKVSMTVDGNTLTTKALIEEAVHNAMGDVRPFEAKIGKDVITRRVQMAREIKDKVGPIIDRMPKGSSTTTDIGKMLGFDLTAGVMRSGGAGANFEVTLAITKAGRTIAAYTSHLSAEKGKQDLEYSIQAARSVFDKLEGDVNNIATSNGDWMRKRIATADEMLPVLKEQKGKPFEQEMVLKTKRARLEEIINELAARKNHNAARGSNAVEPKEEPPGISSLDELDALGLIGNIENHRPGTEHYTANILPERMVASLQTARALSAVPAAVARRQALEQGLTQLIERLVGKAVKVQFADTIPIAPEEHKEWGYIAQGATSAGGLFMPESKIIKLALADPKHTDPQGTAFHEAVHALEFLLANDKELDLMKRETPRLRPIVQKAFGLTDEHLARIDDVEIRAMAGDAYLNSRAQGPGQGYYGVHIGLRSLFERMMTFLRKIKDFILGRGYKSYDDLMDDLYEGKIADREGRAMPEWPKEGAPKAEEAMPALRTSKSGAGRPTPVMDRIRDRISAALGSDTAINLKEGLHDQGERRRLLRNDVEAMYRNWADADGNLPDQKDFYELSRLFPNKRAARIDVFDKEHFDPLEKWMRQNKFDLDAAGRYLTSLHVPERNAEIGKLYPAGHDFNKAVNDHDVVGGSGFSYNEAKKMNAEAKNGQYAHLLPELRRRMTEIRDWTQQEMRRGRLESQSTIDQWNKTYKNYINMSGWEDPLEEPEEVKLRTMGRKKNAAGVVAGPEVKTAFGRKTLADNPITNAIKSAYRTIERAEKNLVNISMSRALSSLPREAGRELGVRFDKGTPMKIVDPHTGLAREINNPADRFSDRAVPYKIDGVTHFLLFDDPRIAEALKRWSPTQLSGALRAIQTVQQKWKSLITIYSPSFEARHQTRYYIENMLNAMQLKETGKYSPGQLAKDSFPLVGAATRAIFAQEMGSGGGGKLGSYWAEMKAGGGATAMKAMRDMDNFKDDMRAKLAGLGSSTMNPLRWLRESAKTVHLVTSIMDNAQRLGQYAAARDQGMSPQKAAIVAAEATVDYNMRGLWSNYIALAQPFFNVAEKTGARMWGRQGRSAVMRKVFLATLAAGLAMSAWNYAAGGTDEDGIPFVDKVAPWDANKAMVIMMPWIKDEKGRPGVLKLPFPFNWAFPLSAGSAIGNFVWGSGTVPQIMMQRVIGPFLSTFSQVGEEGLGLNTIIPEIMKSPYEVATNKDWKGAEVHINPAFQKGPNSESGKKNIDGYERTGEGWKETARALNYMSGGTQMRSGVLDFYPEDIKAIFEPYIGTMLTLGEDIGATVGSAIKGEAPAPTHVPVSKIFYGTDYDASDRARAGQQKYENSHQWTKGVFGH